jgi:ribosomal protein S18 acetylase RimI-like enzyme
VLRRIRNFTADEVTVALEVFGRAAETGNGEYVGLLAFAGERLAGAVAYGETPMTVGTYDLYWILTDPELQRTGVGAFLLAQMDADLRRRGARLVRIETSGTSAYDGTRGFYERAGYRETARIPDFYRPGDDLVMFTRRVPVD